MESVKIETQAKSFYFERNMFADISNYSVADDVPLHWHDFYELEYIVKGCATQVINGKEYHVGPGCATLLSPVDFHCFKEINPDDPLVVYNVKFSDLLLPPEVRAELCTTREPIPNCNERVMYILEHLHEEYRENNYAKQPLIQAGVSILCILLLRAARDMGVAELSSANVSHSPVQQAVLYIRSHFRGPITVEEVAKEVHLTPNYFSEYFKKQTGVKFSAYVQKLRLDFAVSLLKLSNISVKQVAEESGFNSAAYFSNAFKDYFDISPEQFRKSHLRKLPTPVTITKLVD